MRHIIALLFAIITISAVHGQDTVRPVITVTPASLDSLVRGSLACPVLLVHGFNASPEVWGFDVGDEAVVDGHENNNTYIYRHFSHADRDNGGYPTSVSASFLTRYYNVEQTDINHNYLEVFNASNRLAISQAGFNGQTDELYNRMVEVLDEYYGFGWEHDLNQKLILVCHGWGGLVARNLFERFDDNVTANAVAHVERVVTLATPFSSTVNQDERFGSDLGPFPVALSMGGQEIVYTSPRKILITGLSGTRNFPINSYTSVIQVPFDTLAWLDPLNHVRERLTGQRSSLAPINGQMDFGKNLCTRVAVNPCTKALQPWVFVTFKGSNIINEFTRHGAFSAGYSQAVAALLALNGAGDLVVPIENQSLIHLYPAEARNRIVFEIPIDNSVWHCEEPGLYPAIIAALEEPVQNSPSR